MPVRITDRDKTRIRVTEVIALLMTSPRTLAYIHRRTGMSQTNLRQWISHWHDKGLVYITRWDNVATDKGKCKRYARVYAWTDGEPFSRADAPPPRQYFLQAPPKATTVDKFVAINTFRRQNPKLLVQELAKQLGCHQATIYRAASWEKHNIAAKAANPGDSK